MCGIIGVFSRNPINTRGWLAAGRDRLSHRGPDDSGEWWSPDGRVGFGHRRLAIVDLSLTGHQPMLSEDAQLCLVFNGEIYNFHSLRAELISRGHRFLSGSDTAVILATYREWGLECLERLHGMFAFALYDARKQWLFLARDRAGEKPLFYFRDTTGIRFASEIKGLLADESLPRRLDWSAFDRYLADGHTPGDQSMLQQIRKLRPGHALLYDTNGDSVKTWRYWHAPPPPSNKSELHEEYLEADLEKVLEDSVRRQLVADVPVGVLLSGGVDSSVIAALASRAAKQVKTFTVRFPGCGGYDETEHARLIARHFNTHHVEVDAEVANVALLPMLSRQFDEPVIDSSMIPTYLVSRLVRHYCTVALGGDGGDELFGGYPRYDRLLRFERWASATPICFRNTISGLVGELVPTGTRGRNWFQAVSADWRIEVPPVNGIFDSVTRRKLLKGGSHWPLQVPSRSTLGADNEFDLLQRATRLDFDTYLPEDLLVKVDRASMLNSLEMRAPFLDVPVIEFAFGRVPSHLKATRGERKILLKRLAKKILPSEFNLTRKQGFSIPLSKWIQSGPWRDFFQGILLDSSPTWFNRRVVEKMLRQEGHGRDNSERLYGLLMFELWRREYRVEM